MAGYGRFSSRHKTYDDWDRAAGNSSYTNRIRRLHAQYPNRTLGALRRSRLVNVPLSKRNYDALTPKQQSEREKALEVKRGILRGSDLVAAALAAKIAPNLVISHLGNAISVSARGKVRATKKDSISRGLIIYTNGHIEEIVVDDSEQASIIGEYMNAVQDYLNTGDEDVLLASEGSVVRDENGLEYELETDPDLLQEIDESTEDRELRKIYSGGS